MRAQWQQTSRRIHFFYGKENANYELGTGFLYISAVKKVEFANDRMSYIILRGRWFHIIVLEVHAPTEDKIVYVKHSFYIQYIQ
jgi:hypothetical protein